jgi:hypothetical protein
VTDKPSSNITPPVFLRFADLVAMGVVFNYPHLRRLKALGFPPGRWLSANVRVWTRAEIDAYIASLPTERPTMPQNNKRRDRKTAVAPKAKVGTARRQRLGRPVSGAAGILEKIDREHKPNHQARSRRRPCQRDDRDLYLLLADDGRPVS